mmetsp:Transcript_107909/g.315496  ORF Transcript_107909/g.315496 Transcript_107909/m.315496 type:complete len:254 (+) Transcript_107909:1151-1912(+)
MAAMSHSAPDEVVHVQGCRRAVEEGVQLLGAAVRDDRVAPSDEMQGRHGETSPRRRPPRLCLLRPRPHEAAAQNCKLRLRQLRAVPLEMRAEHGRRKRALREAQHAVTLPRRPLLLEEGQALREALNTSPDVVRLAQRRQLVRRQRSRRRRAETFALHDGIGDGEADDFAQSRLIASEPSFSARCDVGRLWSLDLRINSASCKPRAQVLDDIVALRGTDASAKAMEHQDARSTCVQRARSTCIRRRHGRMQLP